MATHGYQQQGLPQPPPHQTGTFSPSSPYENASVPRHIPPTSPSHSKQRSFSFQSHKSHKSSGSGSKHDLQESHLDKEARRLHSKADPTLAMHEAEPSAVAVMKGESTHMPLRSMQHKDHWGNAIADPDLSNPTRNRWERPLDTIRSFEDAIDGGYSRKSMHRSQTDSIANWNRRSTHMPASQPRFPQDSYYGSRPVSTFRPESNYGMGTPGTARNSYFEGQGYNNRQRASRTQTDPQYGGQNVYPLPHKDRSYETVTSAAASGSSADPAGYHTDLTSSDNSSVERRPPAKRQEPVNDYGIGFSHSQQYQNGAFTVGLPANNGHHPLPPPPTNQFNSNSAPVARKEVPSMLARQVSQPRAETPTNEKRKSWFTRRFSKNL